MGFWEFFAPTFKKIMYKCISMAYECDDKDVAILRVLSGNSRLSFREAAKRLKMHPNSVMERVRRMEREGVIEKYTIRPNYRLLGYKVTAVIQVDVEGNTDSAMKKIARFPCVENAYRTTGEYDGIAIVVCREIDDLGRLVNEINGVEGVQRVNTKVVLSEFRGAGCAGIATF